jgi:dolichyl-phosphate-mannose-protein mannosyltransferase
MTRTGIWNPGVVVFLVLATFILRVPLLTPRLAHWDAVNYALGMHDFNIAAHQPHPPGSPYFILLARGAYSLLGDDNAALTLIALGASIVAVLGEYAFIRMAFGRRAALLGACMLSAQPIFWAYGTFGNAWSLLAALAVAIGIMCLLLVRGHRHLAIPSALVLGIVSGFRADAAIFLAPLWLWSLWKATPKWRDIVSALAVFGAAVLAWVVAVSASAGGPMAWLQRLLALLPSTNAPPDALLQKLQANTAITFGILALLAAPSVLLSLVIDRQRAMTWVRALFRSDMAMFWMLAIVPAFAFLWLVDSTEPGHNLVFAGAIVALAAGLLDYAATRRVQLFVAGALVIALQAGLFLLPEPVYDDPVNWTMDTMLRNVTAPGLRQQQESLEAALDAIRRFDPQATAVLTVVGQDPYRFMMYYLPDYEVMQLDAGAHAALHAFGRHAGNWTEVDACLLSNPARRVLLVVSHFGVPAPIPPDATLVTSPNAPRPFEVWQLNTTGAKPDYLGFNIGTPCNAAVRVSL